MVDLSLLGGCVPENWRAAVVIPLLKQPELDLVLKNYRPVSNLPFISKVYIVVRKMPLFLNSSPASVNIT